MSHNSHKEMCVQRSLTRWESEYQKLELLQESSMASTRLQRCVVGWQFRCCIASVILLNMAVISVVESVWEWDHFAKLCWNLVPSSLF